MNVVGYVVDMTCSHSWKSFVEKWESRYLMEQRQMRLVNLIEFWTFVPLFLFFKMLISQSRWPLHGEQRVWFCKTDQDGLCMGNRGDDTITDVSFCQKQLLYFLDNSVFVSL